MDQSFGPERKSKGKGPPQESLTAKRQHQLNAGILPEVSAPSRAEMLARVRYDGVYFQTDTW
eukprot:699774-Karenia_brevis.AAC.1